MDPSLRARATATPGEQQASSSSNIPWRPQNPYEDKPDKAQQGGTEEEADFDSEDECGDDFPYLFEYPGQEHTDCIFVECSDSDDTEALDEMFADDFGEQTDSCADVIKPYWLEDGFFQYAPLPFNTF